MRFRRQRPHAAPTSEALGAVDYEVVDHAPPELPLVARDRWHLDADDRVVVPRCGAVVAIVGARTPMLGYLLVRPARNLRSVAIRRRDVIGLADDVAQVLEG